MLTAVVLAGGVEVTVGLKDDDDGNDSICLRYVRFETDCSQCGQYRYPVAATFVGGGTSSDSILPQAANLATGTVVLINAHLNYCKVQRCFSAAF